MHMRKKGKIYYLKIVVSAILFFIWLVFCVFDSSCCRHMPFLRPDSCFLAHKSTVIGKMLFLKIIHLFNQILLSNSQYQLVGRKQREEGELKIRECISINKESFFEARAQHMTVWSKKGGLCFGGIPFILKRMSRILLGLRGQARLGQVHEYLSQGWGVQGAWMGFPGRGKVHRLMFSWTSVVNFGLWIWTTRPKFPYTWKFMHEVSVDFCFDNSATYVWQSN